MKTKKVEENNLKVLLKGRTAVETLTRDEGWKLVEYGSWSEIIEAGWVFLGQERTGTISMSRDGYINEFRNVRT